MCHWRCLTVQACGFLDTIMGSSTMDTTRGIGTLSKFLCPTIGFLWDYEYIYIYIYKWFIIGLTTFISRYLFERILVTYALRAYLSKLFSWFLDLDHSKTGKGRGSRFLRLNWGPIEGEPWWCHNKFSN